MNPMNWFKIKKPEPLQEFHGLTLTAYPTAKDVYHRSNGEKMKVEHIAGNLTHQTMFQINGSHLVSMYDAYATLNREPFPTLREHQDFLSTVATKVEQCKPERSLIDRSPH